jgi:hypothetical protein
MRENKEEREKSQFYWRVTKKERRERDQQTQRNETSICRCT